MNNVWVIDNKPAARVKNKTKNTRISLKRRNLAIFPVKLSRWDLTWSSYNLISNTFRELFFVTSFIQIVVNSTEPIFTNTRTTVVSTLFFYFELSVLSYFPFVCVFKHLQSTLTILFIFCYANGILSHILTVNML